MNQIKSQLQRAARRMLGPIARAGRRMLTPSPPPIEFQWHEIHAGPAQGTRALLPTGAAISDAITSGSYEEQILAFVVALVGDTDVCWDIGGHYGYYTLCLARLAQRGQVHTFEPVKVHASRIEQAAQRSGCPHVTVHHAAVAADVGEMSLRWAEGGVGDDSMAYLDSYGGVDTPAAHEHYPLFSRTTVRTVTLDSLLHQLPLPRFIKIDAEGAEGAILSAGRELISRARPRMLIELHGIYEAIQCAELLSGLNYRAILLTDQKTTMPILWTGHEDVEAVACVQSVLGRPPITMFEPTLPAADSRRDRAPPNDRAT